MFKFETLRLCTPLKTLRTLRGGVRVGVFSKRVMSVDQ